MSTQTEVPLTCSLLNLDQTWGADEEKPCISPLHCLNLVVISVTSRKTQSYARKKILHGKVCLNFLYQIIVNNLLA